MNCFPLYFHTLADSLEKSIVEDLETRYVLSKGAKGKVFMIPIIHTQETPEEHLPKEINSDACESG